jgi:hypothetical protein
VPAVPPANRRVRLRHSSRSASPPLLRRRCNHRLRRPGRRQRKRNAPSCRLRPRIMPGILTMCAARAVRCARAIVS